MKYVVFGLLVTVGVFVFGLQTTSAQGEFIWSGSVSFEEFRDIKESHVELPFYCDFKNVSSLWHEKESVIEDDHYNPLLFAISVPVAGESCTIENTQGAFKLNNSSLTNDAAPAGFYSPNYDHHRFVRSGNLITPAPKSSHVLKLHRSNPYSDFYDLVLYKSYSDWGKIVFANNSEFKWTIDSLSQYSAAYQQLKFSNGNNVEVTNHAFSDNGRHAVFSNREGIWTIDFATMERTMIVPKIELRKTKKPTSLAVSNDGNYVVHADKNENLIVHDATNCSVVQQPGSWELYYGSGVHVNPGCVLAGNFKSHYEHLVRPDSSLKRLLFSPNSSDIYFSLYSNVWNNPDDPYGGGYSWKELRLRADNYRPSATGYLAMGDSYSSGEGDNQGGIWYEPGTDEQGDSGTFAGRNLCHLSRRSYPYLIAHELGYLAGNNRTPPADGLFHSVACSGAKIHNVGRIYGEKHNDGDKGDFEKTSNQYRFTRRQILEEWHPGITGQINSLTGIKLVSGESRNFHPEIITLGVGGNDAGFGDFLAACAGYKWGLIPNTCEYTNPESDQANRAGMLIANLKNELVSLYWSIKSYAPDARVYVHGYPEFVRRSGGNCGVNVKLNDEERYFAVEAIRYTNDIIEAAAKEAGVYYVDVENILSGGRLCDGASDDNVYVNGVTKGNDRGVVIGNESFHPTPSGFVRYKQQVLLETDYLRAPMPEPNPVPVPVPPEHVFGSKAAETVRKRNKAREYNKPNPVKKYFEKLNLIVIAYKKGYKISIDNLLPGSKVEIYVHSETTHLGTFTVNEDGELEADIELPELAAGYHELEIQAVDKFGVQKTYYDPFSVPVSAEDFDGDGIADDQDDCPTLYDTGADTDNDGVDDGCDPVITTSAATNSSSQSNSMSSETQRSATNTNAEQNGNTDIVATAENDAIENSNTSEEETPDSGSTLGSTANSEEDLLSNTNNGVGSFWWMVAITLSSISILSLVIKKFAYAKTKQ